MKKFRFTILSLLLFVVSIAATIDTSNALYTSLFTVSNPDSAATDTLVFFPVSGRTLSDNGFMSTDTLDGVVAESSTESVPSQPPSLLQAMQSAQADDGTVFTDETTESNNDTPDDMTLLPATVAASDAYYFGGDFRFRILTVNISQAGVGDWDGTWEYWNGSAWQNLLGIDDRTDGFKNGGLRTVSWTLPDNWASTTVNGVASFYVRYIVDTVTTTVTQPLGQQSWWETGYWITYVASLDQNEQVQYTGYFGGTDFVENHQFFPGSGGYTTPDDPSIELGASSWAITIEGFFNTDSTSGDYLLKTGAIHLENNASGSIRLSITDGVDVNTATVTGVTSGFYSIVISSDQISTTLTVPGVGSDSTNALTIADSANDWVWGNGDTILYFNTIQISFPDINEEWTSSGPMGDGATFTDTSEYLDWQQFVSIGSHGNATFGGGTIAAGNLWVTDTTGENLVELDETDATITVSTCGFVGFSNSDGIAYDGSNFWITDMGANDDLKEVDSTCNTLNTYDISSVATNGAPVAFDGTDVAVFGDIAPGPTLNIYNTSGVLQSSNQITALSGLGIFDATFIDPFYYVQTTSGLPGVTAAWRMTDHTDAQPVWIIDGDQYGSAFDGVTNIQPGYNILASEILATDGSTFWFKELSGSNDRVLTLTTSEFSSSHIRIFNDWLTTVPEWTFGVCGNCYASLSDAVTAPDGTYFAVIGANSSGTASLRQETAAATITPGLAYSFGVKMTCGGEDQRLEVDWLDSGGSIIGSTLTAVPTCSGAFHDLALENEIAPVNSDHVRLRFEHQCSAPCTGVEYSRWDSVQIVQNTAIEPFPPASTNLIENPSFEELFDSSVTYLWESDSVSLSAITDVFSSTLIWGETTPDDSSLLIETSIDGGSQWDTATNGSSIPGIDPGDDLTGVSLLIRGTFTPSTDEQDTPQLDSMSIQVVDSTGFALDYSPQEFIGLTLTDESPNTNDATTSFPDPTGFTTSVGAFTPTGNVAIITDTEDSPEVIGDISPGDELTDPSTVVLPADFPLRDLFISFANMADIPVIVPLIWAGLLFVLYVGLATYSVTGSVAATTFGLVIGVLALTSVSTGVFPIWILIFFVIGATGMLLWTRIGSIGI